MINRKIIVFLGLYVGLYSCGSVRKLSDKTQEIKKSKTLVIIKPFVLSAGLSDPKIINNIRDSLFDAHITSEMYKRNVGEMKPYKIGSLKNFQRYFHNQLLLKEKYFQDYSIKVYKKYFKSLYNLYIPEITDSALTTLQNEVKKLEIKLHDSTLTTLKITPSFEAMLSKYGDNSLFLIIDITDYYVIGAYGMNRTYAVEWTLSRVFIIHPKQGEVIFYKYKISSSTGVADNPFFVTFGLKEILKELKNN